MKGFLHRLKTRTQVLMRKIVRMEYIHDILLYLTNKTPSDANFQSKIEADLKQTIRPSIKFGLSVIAVGFGFFVVWGGLAPLDSAATAEGTIVVAGNHKAVQHLEGGIVEKLMVKDGQTVKEGDVLMVLNSSKARAELAIYTNRLNFAVATQARLMAELNNYDKVYWDDDAFDYSDPEITEIIKTQDQFFHSRTSSIKGQLQVLDERIAQKQEEIIGLEKQLKSVESQVSNIQAELKNMDQLLKKGLTTSDRVLHLRNSYDDALSREAGIKAEIAKSKEVIAETKLEKINVDHKYRTELSNEIKENHSHLLEYTEQYTASKDVLDRTVIKAPASGIITELQVHTVGGVIGQGQKLMDVVPQDEKLIIEAKVRTQDIDSIHPGLVAKVQLGAFKSRLMPRINGKVIYVGADKITDQHVDPRTGAAGSYYLAKIEVDESELASLALDVKLYPGMPATVFIVKGERTFLQYLISPIRDSFFKAFKEA